MARKDEEQGRQRPMKGFRPGKEPPELKRRMAKARLPADATWLQKQTVEAVAGKSPREVEMMVRNWFVGVLVVAVAVGVAGVFVYLWSVMAAIIVHLITAALLFLAYRLRKQGPHLVEMAERLR